MPESTAATVLLTYRPREGEVESLEQLLVRQRATLARLALLADPQRTFRAADAAGRPVFLDLLTWKDVAVTGNPPPEVGSLWGELHKLVEPRDGRPGIEIQHLTPVES
ncbi:MAG TPA: hypothetical protein VFE33_09470 [Thermoanaerobaculia bacterium]|nr:hypothetical protein [Thermoanaerobaculia bacterium]